VLAVAGQRYATLVTLVPSQHNDRIYQRPDPEPAEGDELQQAGTNFAQVEAVNSEEPEEKGQQPGGDEGFLGRRGPGAVWNGCACGMFDV
jgi:hypothetical protein